MQTVLIVNVPSVAKFLRKNRDVAKWMANWLEITEDASWQNIHDVRQDYPSADGVTMNDQTVVTVFNVKGNTYRLLTRIAYRQQIVYVISILTHAEYSKGKWKG